MTDTERFEVALIQVQSGETITTIVRALYSNRRQYSKHASTHQRAELARARKEYLSQKPAPRRKQNPRLIFETTPERRQTIKQHCQQVGISIARFVNSAVVEALSRARRT